MAILVFPILLVLLKYVPKKTQGPMAAGRQAKSQKE